MSKLLCCFIRKSDRKHFCALSQLLITTNQNYLQTKRNLLQSQFLSVNNNAIKPLSVIYRNVFHNSKNKMDVPEGVFVGKIDRFNGITVESKVEYVQQEDFIKKLEKSLNYWINSNKRCIWFKVYTAHSSWISTLTEHGFEFHHAKHGYVMLYRWLPENETPNLPDFAHTLMGVGGLVINEQNEILTVSDRHAMIPDSWKLPGGYVDPKEHFVEAAIREVREETGIDCTFDTVVNFRHSHGGSFGCSDIYIVIALKPLHLNLQRCEREIAKLTWMPVDEFLNHPHVHTTNREVVRTYLEYLKNGIKMTCKKAIHPVLKKEYMIYRMHTDETLKTEQNNEN